MTIYYHDWVNGNDGTGDGSSSNPYKTFTYTRDIASEGDEIRVAKTEVRSYSVNTTWTNDSTLVSTASSLIGSIAVGDHISKPTGGGNGNHETVYRVEQITATTITVEVRYAGTTETTSEIHARTPYDTADRVPVNINKTLTYSGGWNLTTETRDGETWFAGSAPFSSAHMIVVNSKFFGDFSAEDL